MRSAKFLTEAGEKGLERRGWREGAGEKGLERRGWREGAGEKGLGRRGWREGAGEGSGCGAHAGTAEGTILVVFLW